MLSVCAHVQVRKALLVQDLLGHDGLREQVPLINQKGAT